VGIPLVAVRLQNATEPFEMLARMLALSVGTVMIQHRRRRLSGERAVIADIAPQPASAGFSQTRFQHRHRGIIGMHSVRRHHMRADGVDQRAHQARRLSALRWHSTGFAGGTLASYAQSARVERSSSTPPRA
jgi:hypothetical protein